MLPEYKHVIYISNTVSVAFVKVVLIASSIHLTNTFARMSAPLWLHSVFVSRTLFLYVCDVHIVMQSTLISVFSGSVLSFPRLLVSLLTVGCFWKEIWYIETYHCGVVLDSCVVDSRVVDTQVVYLDCKVRILEGWAALFHLLGIQIRCQDISQLCW